VNSWCTEEKKTGGLGAIVRKKKASSESNVTVTRLAAKRGKEVYKMIKRNQGTFGKKNRGTSSPDVKKSVAWGG